MRNYRQSQGVISRQFRRTLERGLRTAITSDLGNFLVVGGNDYCIEDFRILRRLD